MDGLYNFKFADESIVIDELITACLYKQYYIALMGTVIDNIANDNFSDLIHDDVDDVLLFISIYGNNRDGTMGDINIEVLDFEYNRLLYNALIAKNGGDVHIYANCRDMSTKRNLVGKSYTKCENLIIDDMDVKMNYISNLNYEENINFPPISSVCR
jgi:hypothetical protein